MSTEQVEDWSSCEITDAEPTLGIDEAKLLKMAPESRDREIVSYRQKVAALVPTDDVTLKSCGVFVEQCKLAAKRVEEERTALVAPLNKQVDDINAVRIPVRDLFKEMAKVVTEKCNRFLEDRRRKAELEQQRINAEAAAKQAELDRKSEEARAKAADALAAGNVTEAIKLDSKADQLAQKAAEAVPEQAALPSSRVELDDTTVSFKGPKKIWSLTGWDKKKPLPVLSPELKGLVGDISKLPEGLRFILQHADLNPVRLNATYKGGTKFPAPFTEVNDYSGSTVR